MKALVYTQPKTLIYQDVDTPRCTEDESLVRVDAVGICGSDMHAYLGHDSRRPAPLILGHEAAGVVVEGALTGKTVTINPLVSCAGCADCLDGRANLCARREIISMPPRQGAFAEYVRVPTRNLVEVPAGIPIEHAALTEPLATGYHAVTLAGQFSRRLLSESRALVMGSGAVGLAAALTLTHQGCREIHIAETNAGRRATAQAAGFDLTYAPDTERGPDAGSVGIVIDAVGADATREAAFRAVAPGGVIVHVGLLNENNAVDVRRLTLQEIAFVGCYTYTQVDFQATLRALSSGALGALDWFEDRPLAHGARAFDALLNGEIQASKVILRP